MKIKEGLSNIVFPPRCPVCDEVIYVGKDTCEDCRKKVICIGEPSCKKCGKPLEDQRREYCTDCMRKKHYFSQGKAVFVYQGEIRQSMYRFKYSNKREYADFYAKEAVRIYGDWIRRKQIEAIVPVPMYRWKEKGRGYNQAAVFARTLGEKMNLPVEKRMVKRIRNTTPQKELNDVIMSLNLDSEVDGILVQMPLPSHLDETAALELIDPQKDVDGLHPMNAGCLLTNRPGFIPCTPQGVMAMLDSIGCKDLSGKRAVVCGRSNLVGKPVALLLQNRNATVTIVHSKTPDIEKIASQADILIVAMGVAQMVNENWVKEGAVVIDVGINRVNGKLVGDCDFESVAKKASYVSPVPKGVGPMTVCMLLSNTLDAYHMHMQGE